MNTCFQRMRGGKTRTVVGQICSNRTESPEDKGNIAMAPWSHRCPSSRRRSIRSCDPSIGIPNSSERGRERGRYSGQERWDRCPEIVSGVPGKMSHSRKQTIVVGPAQGWLRALQGMTAPNPVAKSYRTEASHDTVMYRQARTQRNLFSIPLPLSSSFPRLLDVVSGLLLSAHSRRGRGCFSFFFSFPRYICARLFDSSLARRPR